MRKRLFCEARIDLTLEITGPFLINSNMTKLSGADMAPVTSYAYRDKSSPFPYIPGTSIKGALRSHSEKIIRTITERENSVCYPYVQDRNAKADEKSCGKRLESYTKEIPRPTDTIYKKSCAACKIFGSLVFKGRTFFTDAYSPNPDEIKTEIRDGVAIDRKTGGSAKGAKYQFEVITRGNFETTVGIENFEAWQLALLLMSIWDFSEGRLAMGMGSSRGLGNIRAEVKKVELYYPFNLDQGKLFGISKLLELKDELEEINNYGFMREPQTGHLSKLNLEGPQHQGFWNVYRVNFDQDLLQWSREVLSHFVKEYKWTPQS